MEENLLSMIQEFCKRSRTHYTPEHVIDAIKTCRSIITDEGFYVFQIWMDELQVLFGYVKPGVNGRLYLDIIEDIGRINHCKRVVFATAREAGFARMWPDYQPTARVFTKEL
jgi:hypothetical protein